MPSCPDSQVAVDGISRRVVNEQKSTAPISSGLRPALPSAFRAARSDRWSRSIAVYSYCSRSPFRRPPRPLHPGAPSYEPAGLRTAARGRVGEPRGARRGALQVAERLEPAPAQPEHPIGRAERPPKGIQRRLLVGGPPVRPSRDQDRRLARLQHSPAQQHPQRVQQPQVGANRPPADQPAHPPRHSAHCLVHQVARP